MSEYIARDVAIAIIEEKQKELCPVGRYSRHYVYGTDRERFDAWQEIINALVTSKTADVEEVVRCKDCKHYRNHPNGLCYLYTEPKENEHGYSGEAVCVEPDDFAATENGGKSHEDMG